MATLLCYTSKMLSTNPLQDLRTAIEVAQDIRRVDNQYTFTTPGGVVTFSGCVLTQCHPHLAEVIDYVLGKHPLAVSTIIRQTMEHWEHPAPLQEHTTDKHITRATYIEASTVPGSYLVRGDRYMTKSVHDDVTIALPLNRSLWVPVSTQWLEQYYPGVTAKIDVLTAMDLPKDEVSRLALEELVNPKLSPDMCNIGFD